jgi:signal transduction histidine kinase/CheY-like chemotaxis protein
MNENTPKLDYLAPSISELTSHRGGTGTDPLKHTGAGQDRMAPVVAKRLLPACVVVPALLWWMLWLGVRRGMYELETCFILFVFSVTVVLGLIVCLNLRKLARMDLQNAKANDQLKRAKEAAESANRFKSAFFANISHEIRTPLTAINGFAELLLSPRRTEEERQSDARVIRRNGEHLLTLINDILDLSKIEAGKMSVERIGCSPAGTISEVCSMLRQRATEKGLTLDVNFEGPIPKLVQTDPTRLRQILINLIANAIKFTKEGGIRLTVWIQPSFRAEKPLLTIKVADTGIGIAPDQQASLFKPFVQGDATIARQYGGSGLGLAISRHFALALEGDITLISMPGHGSTFTVTVGTGSLIEAEVLEHPENALAQDDFVTQRVRISGTVLVAEDGIDNQNLIVAKLRETGLKLEIASNGQIACEKALNAVRVGSPFDLILMDVQMPVMDGFSATLELRSKGYKGPIIALTANAMERDRSKCFAAGCNDFVTKPIQMVSLFKAIGRYLTVVPVGSDAAAAEDAAASAAQKAAQAKKFHEELPGQLEKIEEAIRREDRTQLKEIAQLVLGKASAADLKEVAVLAAKLSQSAENERSWIVLRQVVEEFSRNSKPVDPAREAA